MADDDAENSCRFVWVVLNPFLPFRRMRATFFYGSADPIPWKVTLNPINHEMNRWTFWFRLKCDVPDQLYNVVADINVKISLNERPMEEKLEENFIFTARNWHTYRFRAHASARPLDIEQPCLVIELELSLRGRNIANREINGLDNDTNQLSYDLQLALTRRSFADLTLRSAAPISRFPVHSYIIQARWCNFFRKHTADEIIDNVVAVNISSEVLWEILTYVYTGKLHVGEGRWGEPSFMTELFQVIDHYNLQHLYKVFSRDDSLQIRSTEKHMVIQSRNFRLDDDDNQPLQNPEYVWHVTADTAYYVNFKIKFFLRENYAWCLYTMSSWSNVRIHVQVNLEFKKEFISPFGNLFNNNTFVSMHQNDYKIDAFDEVESSSCPLPPNSDFEDLLKRRCRRGRGIRIEHFIRCILCLSDGTMAVEVLNEDDIGLQGEQKRLHILSDHMHGILMNPDPKDDLHIVCPAKQRGSPDEKHRLHRAFFVNRVPNWRVILGNLEGNEIPLRKNIPVISEAFRLILIYIYTGKVFPIPDCYLDDVDEFARRGEMNGLRNLVRRLREW